jgi:hypothetical protein
LDWPVTWSVLRKTYLAEATAASPEQRIAAETRGHDRCNR